MQNPEKYNPFGLNSSAAAINSLCSCKQGTPRCPKLMTTTEPLSSSNDTGWPSKVSNANWVPSLPLVLQEAPRVVVEPFCKYENQRNAKEALHSSLSSSCGLLDFSNRLFASTSGARMSVPIIITAPQPTTKNQWLSDHLESQIDPSSFILTRLRYKSSSKLCTAAFQSQNPYGNNY